MHPVFSKCSLQSSSQCYQIHKINHVLCFGMHGPDHGTFMDEGGARSGT
jgi:hypothetical protein